MNWDTVLASTISGAVVAWPAVFFGYWLQRAKTRDHIDKVTAQQTKEIKQAMGVTGEPGV